jgi:hypothetical protein
VSSLRYYCRINSAKYPASGAGNVSQPDLISEIGRVGKVVCIDQCVSAVEAVEVLVFVCLFNSCNVVTEVEGPKFCETPAESCHAKRGDFLDLILL